MTDTREADRQRAALAQPQWLTASAWAGIVGPALFTAVFLGLEAVLGARYDRVSEVVSALEAGPYGWVQQINFVVFGILTIAFAIGLHRGIARTRGGAAGPALMFVSGVALVLAAAFPFREDAAGAAAESLGHAVAGVMFFSTSALALVVLSRRMARDPRWRGLSGYALITGLLALAGFVVFGRLVIPDDAPWHAYAGLAQRALILLLVFPCRTVLALRLLRVSSPRSRTA
jgi:hypothetical membrane protein